MLWGPCLQQVKKIEGEEKVHLLERIDPEPRPGLDHDQALDGETPTIFEGLTNGFMLWGPCLQQVKKIEGEENVHLLERIDPEPRDEWKMLLTHPRDVA